MNRDLPTFVVMNAKQSHPKANTQAISAKLWSAGFLSPEYAGVGLRACADPVLYLSDPDGVSRDARRRMLDGLAELKDASRSMTPPSASCLHCRRDIRLTWIARARGPGGGSS